MPIPENIQDNSEDESVDVDVTSRDVIRNTIAETALSVAVSHIVDSQRPGEVRSMDDVGDVFNAACQAADRIADSLFNGSSLNDAINDLGSNESVNEVEETQTPEQDMPQLQGIQPRMFDSIDSLPEAYRTPYNRLRVMAESDPNREVAREVLRALDDAVTNPANSQESVIAYIQYLEAVLSGNGRGKVDKKSKQYIGNKPDKRSKLAAPMGFEFSYHPPAKFSKKKGTYFTGLDTAIGSDSGTITVSNGSNALADFIQNHDVQSERQVIENYQLNSAMQNQQSDLAISSDPTYDPVPCVADPTPESDIEESMPETTPEQEPAQDQETTPETAPEQEPAQDQEEARLPYGEHLVGRRPCGCRVGYDGCNNCGGNIENNAEEAERTLADLNRALDALTRPGSPNNLHDLKTVLETSLEEAGLMKGFGAKLYVDGANLMELCSPVLKNRKSMFTWFKRADAMMKERGFKAWTRKKGGGGMHMNISYNKEVPNWQLAYINFFTMIANYPEINWIFNEPSDNHTATALVKEPRYIKAWHSLKTGESTASEAWEMMSVCGGKGYAINAKDDYHFELRTFEMPRSYSNFVDAVEFINALLSVCMEVASWGVVIPLELELPTMYSEGAEDRGYLLDSDDKVLVFAGKMWSADEDFNRLLRWLNLDPKRYTKYRRRNYHTRRGSPYGKKYFN